MAQSVNVADVLTRIRNQGDIETNDQANSAFPDAILVDWLNQAYRALYDVITDAIGKVGEAHFATTTSVGPSSWTLPTDFYRELGIDYSPAGTRISARPFNFSDRNRDSWLTSQYPFYRVVNGSLVWRPSNPTVAVTLWYIPTPTTLASNGAFNAFNGWDDYVTQWVVRQVKLRQDYPVEDVAVRLNEAERRVRRAAKRVASYEDVVADVETRDFYDYLNS